MCDSSLRKELSVRINDWHSPECYEDFLATGEELITDYEVPLFVVVEMLVELYSSVNSEWTKED